MSSDGRMVQLDRQLEAKAKQRGNGTEVRGSPRYDLTAPSCLYEITHNSRGEERREEEKSRGKWKEKE